jgi:Tryptophan halogenase
MEYDIAIIGGGTSGWLAAAYLSFHNPTKSICLVESPNIPIIGVGEGTFPTTMWLLRSIGIPPYKLLAEANGGVKLGIEYREFSEKPFWLSTAGPEEWETWGTDMAKHVALSGKTAPIEGDNFVACHFVASDLAQLLKEHSVGLGVTHISAEVVDTEVVNNRCRSVTLDTGGEIIADWFLDCTGFSRLLIKQTDSNFTSYAKELLVDSAVVGPTPYKDKSKEFYSYSQITARTAGWQFRIPTWTRVGNGYVYSSHFSTPEEAETELRSTVSVDQVKHLKMTLGYYDDLIVGNIVATGLSGGFIEPMEATAIHLTERTIIAFNDILQNKDTVGSANEYLRNKIRYIKTLILAHYAFSKRTEPFWRAARAAAADSDEIRGFFSGLQNGKFPTAQDKLDIAYPYTQWNELLKGFSQPHYYPTINKRSKEQIYMSTYFAPTHYEHIEKLRNKNDKKNLLSQ